MRLKHLVLAAVLLASRAVAAYPQFQFSLGDDRCGACHLAPSGGGLLNDYGRDQAGSAIGRGGDGRFLHGLWSPPSWLTLGGDARFALGDKQVAGQNRTLAFPMQADVYARASSGRFSVALTAGVRGAARDPAPPLQERLISREHYISYERGSVGARVGRFFPVFGLRLPDHTAYVRRFVGFGLLEEPYAVELSHVGDRSETFVTGFVPQPLAVLGAGYPATGIAVSHERRVDDGVLLGGHARFAASPAEQRTTLGTMAKLWMADAGLLWLAELDLQRQTFERGAARFQIAAYLGVAKWLQPGLLISAALHGWDPDVALRASSRDAAELDLQYFVRAHFEIHALARVAAQGNDLDAPGFLSLLQLHYYL